MRSDPATITAGGRLRRIGSSRSATGFAAALAASSLTLSLARSALAEAPAERLTVVDGMEQVRLAPTWTAAVIGVIRAGQSVRLASPEPNRDPGVASCPGGWYAIEPRGYVCLGRRSTLAADDPRALASAAALPDLASASPFHYGVSLGAPRYLRIPTPEEQRRIEKDTAVRALRTAGTVDPRSPSAPSRATPPALAILANHFNASSGPLTAPDDAYEGMKLAWTRELDAAGRTWLVTPDLTLVPKDRVRPVAAPELRGVDLRGERGARLPIAYLWLDAAPKLRRDDDGRLVETGERWPRHAFVPITERVLRDRRRLFLETRDGLWLARDQVTVLRRATARPVGVGPKDKWVSVRVTHGYLVAYEGDEPVFATAVSPGVEGVRPSGRHTTRTGQFVVIDKLFSWDMTGTERGKPWTVRDVPWVAFYKEDYGLHGAWWHDDFGRPRSHGCINLAPEDARFLFDWLDPALPEGWYGVSSYAKARGTTVVVKP